MTYSEYIEQEELAREEENTGRCLNEEAEGQFVRGR